MARVSVILPTYNRERTLRAALASVLAQTYQDFDVVVVDDGSTDGTAGVVQSLGDRVRYVALEHSGLPARARNAGIHQSSGEYVAFLDSDDEWLPDKLVRQIAVLDREPSVALVCSNAALVNGDDARRGDEGTYVQADQGKTGSVYLELLESNFVVTSTAVVRRSALEAAGGFSEEPILRGIEDYDLWLRLSRRADVSYLPEALAVYRRHESSLSSRLDLSTHWRGLARVVQRAREAESGDAVQSTRDALDRRALTYLRAFSTAQRSEQPAESKSDDGELRLHLGCGDVYLEGYMNIDFPPDAQGVGQTSVADLHADLTALSFPAGSIEEIRLHQGFERFDRATARRLLVDWQRWLSPAGRRRPGGTLVIENVDAEPAGYDAEFRRTLRTLGFRRITMKRSELQGIANVVVTARKEKDRPREDLVQAATGGTS